MGKLYTIDGKLLTETPEIRIGDKIYPVDDREKTVKKAMKVESEKGIGPEAMDEMVKLALGEKAFNEISKANYPFSVYKQIFQMAVAAMTGEEPETVVSRFQDTESKQ